MQVLLSIKLKLKAFVRMNCYCIELKDMQHLHVTKCALAQIMNYNHKKEYELD